MATPQVRVVWVRATSGDRSLIWLFIAVHVTFYYLVVHRYTSACPDCKREKCYEHSD